MKINYFRNSRQAANDFKRNLEVAKKKVPEDKMLLFQKALGFKAMNKLIMKTPVDTGRARGGWNADYVTGVGNTTKTLNSKTGAAPIRRITSKINALAVYSPLFIYNNVHYITRLERGHSRQSRMGMLRPTMIELAYELS